MERCDHDYRTWANLLSAAPRSESRFQDKQHRCERLEPEKMVLQRRKDQHCNVEEHFRSSAATMSPPAFSSVVHIGVGGLGE